MNKTFIKIEVVDASSVHDFTTKDSKAVVLEYTKMVVLLLYVFQKKILKKTILKLTKIKLLKFVNL